jgi:hypothetical protein
VYGDTKLRIPAATQSYSNIAKGQSWALIDNAWRRTYLPTPGEANAFLENPQINNTDDPNACTSVVISELLPNPLGEDTDHEWVELSNTSDLPISLSSCVLNIADNMYGFLMDDVLGPHELRISYSLYGENGEDKAISLRNSGETLVALQRVRSDGTLETLQSFIYADAAEGQSWARFEDGWRWLDKPTPGQENTMVAPDPDSFVPTEYPAEDNTDEDVITGGAGGNQQYLPLILTELLPNPAPPQTDEHDEFVEIYNPNAEAVDLKNYKLQTGVTYGYTYTFSSLNIGPGQYIIITSGNTSLSLSNSGGKAKLLNPGGETVSEVDTYSTAVSGSSWAFIDGKWQWTATPTPGAVNTLTAIPLLSTASKSSTKKATASTKKATTPKTSSTKTTAKKSSVKAATTAKNATGSSNVSSKAPPLHAGVLAGVGLLAVGYALYEYRRDIANRIYQFNRYRANRRADR